MSASMQRYYAARASEYERVYARPERQADLRVLEDAVADCLRGRKVLEVACGTGYWTQHIAPVARYVLATDLAGETLEVARSKGLPGETVRFALADAFDLPVADGPFDGAFAGFWWSHLRHGECRAFLESLRPCLSPGATVVLMDNVYVEGSSTPVSRIDAEGNTYQQRRLDNGQTHEVTKNFPAQADLERQVEGFGSNFRYMRLTHFWLFVFDAT
jgi:ubiquinone/menaquinone biosynthesis C-methylase UbiE